MLAVRKATWHIAHTPKNTLTQAYGRTTYLITTIQLVPRGTEGAVSLEGTAAGLAAAVVYSSIALALGQVDGTQAAVVAAAATAANLVESFIGAVAQGKIEWLNNDVVNIIQICLAAVLAMAGVLVA